MGKLTFFETYGIGGIVIFTCMVLLWLLSLRLRNASIVDIFWGMGFVIMTGVYWAVSPAGTLWRKGLLSLLVALWGVRLSLHIFFRNRGFSLSQVAGRGGECLVVAELLQGVLGAGVTDVGHFDSCAGASFLCQQERSECPGFHWHSYLGYWFFL